MLFFILKFAGANFTYYTCLLKAALQLLAGHFNRRINA